MSTGKATITLDTDSPVDNSNGTAGLPIVYATAAFSKQRRRTIAPYLFLLPYFLITLCFFLYPLANALWLAFFQTNGPHTKTFVGFDNFLFVLTDPDFYAALRNTTVFALCSVFVQLPLSLALALLLSARKDKMKGFFRLLIFSPHLVGSVFVGIIFAVLFTPRYGMINKFVYSLIGWGLEQSWLENPLLAMPALVITSLWMYVGFNMIYFMAALQNVDNNLVDAARIDGAGPWCVFLNVTLPAIQPVAVFVVTMSLIGSYQLFELPLTLFSGTAGHGPDNAAFTIINYLNAAAFEEGDLGLGSAVGWILTVIVFVLSLVQIKAMGGTRE